jgi:aspartate kinase/aspartokinase/homoserine dehydrogenase 1
MSRIVVKFGGSNLKAPDDVANLLAVLRLYPEPPVVVVSALHGVTDLLIESMQDIRQNGQLIARLKRRLLGLHLPFMDNHILDNPLREEAGRLIREKVNELGKYLLGVHCFGEIPVFVEDMVLSYGERLSALVLRYVLQANGFEAALLLPEAFGLITDGEHGNASVDLAGCAAAVRREFDRNGILVVPGFYGVSREGKITVFGRGGSDYTAAVLAVCLEATAVDLWKDVPGFMSADPKLVAAPHPVRRLAFHEAAELSYFGAKILHPRTFEPLSGTPIPIRLFNIHQIPPDLQPLTVIGCQSEIDPDVIKSVTFSDDFGILRLRGPGVGIKPGIMAGITTRLQAARINIKSIITAQTAINILFSRKDARTAYKLIAGQGIGAVEEISLRDDVSLIAVVGEGLLVRPGVAARVLSAVSRRRINVELICAGASGVAAYFIVDRADRAPAVNAIHEEFFNENHPGN